MKELAPIEFKMTPADYVAVDAAKICGCPTCRKKGEEVVRDHPAYAPIASRLSLHAATEDFKYWKRTLTRKGQHERA